MNYFWMFFLGILAFSLSAVLTRKFCNPQSHLYLLDYPTSRSLHSNPTPRSGGVAILIALLLLMPIFWVATAQIQYSVIWVVIAIVDVACMGFWDDRYILGVKIRLAGQFVAAALISIALDIYCSISLPGIEMLLSGWTGVLFIILFLVWMTNLYNFMDGMDGFSGGMTTIGFTTMGVIGFINDNSIFMLLNLLVAASAGGFLMFNFPPAKIFMGDAGSVTLGFVAGCMLLWANSYSIMPIWIGIVIFAPFIFDATITLVRRIIRGERFWHAHKTHYYQRLVLLGWGHRRTVLVEYGLMFVCSCTALLALNSSTQTQIFIFMAILSMFTVFFGYITRLEQRHAENIF